MLTPDPPRTVLVETTWRTRQDVVRRLLGAARRLGMDPRVVRWAGRGYVVPGQVAVEVGTTDPDPDPGPGPVPAPAPADPEPEPERPVSKRQRVENALRADPTLLKLTIREIARRLDADASTVSRVRKHLLDQQEVS